MTKSPISREEGYRRGRGKEEGALRVAEDFFATVLDCQLDRIEEARSNYLEGDFRLPSGRTVECKGQPIDPDRYKNNFVKICESTKNPLHEGGMQDLARLLQLSVEELAGVSVRDKTAGGQIRFGSPARLSVSLRNFEHSSHIVYVNPAPSTLHVYVYRSPTLLGMVREAVRERGMFRGAGNSNSDTLAVFVPVSPARWQKIDGTWQSGPAVRPQHLQALQELTGSA